MKTIKLLTFLLFLIPFSGISQSFHKGYAKRDQEELNSFTVKVREYKVAKKRKNKIKLKNLHLGILDDMDREIKQTENKIKIIQKRATNHPNKKNQLDLSQLKTRLYVQRANRKRFSENAKNMKALKKFLKTLKEDSVQTVARKKRWKH